MLSSFGFWFSNFVSQIQRPFGFTMNIHEGPHLATSFHGRLPHGLGQFPKTVFTDRLWQQFERDGALLAFCWMDIDDSIDPNLLSIISFPRTPYVTLSGSNLRCKAITK
jgi:hypothetical protein